MDADGVLVHLFDGARGHDLDLHRLAVFVLAFRFIEHGIQHADHGRPGLGVEPALEVVNHVIGGQFVAVAVLDPLADVKGPSFQVIGRHPLFRQQGTGDVVRAGDRQVFDHLAGDIGLFNPVVNRRVGHVLHLHGGANDAAFLRRLGLGALDDAGAGEGIGEGVSRGGGHAQQGDRAQEFPAVDFAFQKLILDFRNVGMFPTVIVTRHFDFLPVKLSYVLCFASCTVVAD